MSRLDDIGLSGTVINLWGPEASRKRWAARRLATAFPLMMLTIVNTLRLGIVDHLWPAAVTIDVVLLGSLPILLRYLRTRDERTLAAASPGTWFAGGGSVKAQQLEQQRRFQLAVAGIKGTLGTGYIGGACEVGDDGVSFLPGSFFGFGATRIVIPWPDITRCDLTKIPAKFNCAGIDLALSDGSRLTMEARGYDRLRAALASHIRRDGVPGATR